MRFEPLEAIVDEIDRKLRQLILELTARRGPDKSICPSEVARNARPDDWRSLMPRIRRQAVALVEEGRIVVLQSNKQVDPAKVHGPIRLRIAK